MPQFDPAAQKHWRFARQTNLKRSDFVEPPPGVTAGDALVGAAAAAIAVVLIVGTCLGVL